MDEVNSSEVDEPMSRSSKVLLVVAGFLFLVFIFHYGVKTLRNNDYRELSERFIRGNGFIANEVGEITRIGGGQAVRRGGEWEITRSVTGTQKKLLVTVVLYCNRGGTDPGVGCTVKSATHTGDAQTEPQEIPIPWYDNFLIVYR